MPTNLAVRLSTMSHTLVARNRKVRPQTGPWAKFLRAGLFLAVVGIFATIYWAYGNIRSTSLHYEISQAQEMQKQHLDLNSKLRVELSNLKSIGRLEKLAETYEMGPPAPGQVIKVSWP